VALGAIPGPELPPRRVRQDQGNCTAKGGPATKSRIVKKEEQREGKHVARKGSSRSLQGEPPRDEQESREGEGGKDGTAWAELCLKASPVKRVGNVLMNSRALVKPRELLKKKKEANSKGGQKEGS